MRSLLAYSTTSTIEEKLTLRIKADNSGNIYLPTGGLSFEGTTWCEYDWMVSIDGWSATRYSGIGSWSIRVWYGLNPLSVHTVIVKPTVEEYGWLRAFAYKWTSIASSLVNIISDKSYKGYALNEFNAGNYFKAYQYQWCTSLVNTDEELLPDTLLIIGDYYRYYEYSGCTSLVANAEEKILKTVRVIGDYYRAYQYQNCTWINKVNMRAINWASVWNNYRLNQYSWIWTDRNQVSIYIEWWIEEWGSWGLSNNNVKSIYVYEWLVSDYRTKLSSITSSKIQKNADWDNNEYEFIEYIWLADSSWKIRIPVGWYSTAGAQNCTYDWYVSIDGWEPTEITGTGSATYVSVGSGLSSGSEHRVVIKPATIWWWWGRAFWFYNTWAQAYIKEIIHDSYKCYASSRTSTGNYYKYSTYNGCTNLINSYEKLPTSVTTVGSSYMKQCYMGCTSLTDAFWEVMHRGCSIGADYRYEGYKWCSNMVEHQGMAWYNWTYPTNYKKDYLDGAWTGLDIYITRYEILPTDTLADISQVWYTDSYEVATITKNGRYRFYCDVYEGGSTWSTTCYLYKNTTLLSSKYRGDSWTVAFELDFDAVANDVIKIKVEKGSDWHWSCKNIELTGLYNSAGIDDERVDWIYCFLNDIIKYEDSSNWIDLKDKLRAWYYPYKTHTAIDINRYTRLVASKSLTTYNWNTSPDWLLIGQISVSKKPWFPVIMLNGEWDSSSSHYIYLFSYNLTPNNLSSMPTIWNTKVASYSTREYERWVSWDMDIFWNNYYVSEKELPLAVLNNVSYSGRESNQTWFVTKVSRNGQFIFSYLDWYKRFVANSIPWTSFRQEDVDTSVVWVLKYSLMFSDDGLTMYKANSDNTALEQWSLVKPRDFYGATNTWKTLSIDGYCDMSSDGKYLFKYKSWTIYQYTYE